MRKLLIPVIAAGLIAAPAQANDPAIDLGPGAFVGARVKLPLGGKTSARPHVGFAIAPTRSSMSSGGMVRTQIGEGFMLDFTSTTKPTLTLAGIRADRALGLRSQDHIDADNKLGISTGAWIGIGLAAAIVGGGLLFYAAATDCDDDDDECGF